jgi:vancomycin resistance protein VanJ
LRYLKRSFIASTFAVCAGTSVLMLAGPEHIDVLSDLQYLPWYAFLVPALACVGLSMRLGWRWRAMSVASVLLVPAVLMDFTFASGEKGEHAVRVMTFNVKDYETLRAPASTAALAAEIRRFDPDIAVMQDASEFNRLAYREKLFTDRQVWASGEFMVVSRHPIERCREIRVPVPGKAMHDLVCRVRSPDWQLDVHVVHLVSPRVGLTALARGLLRGVRDWDDNVDTRMDQARALADYVASAPRPAIVAGDLNAPAHSLVLRRLVEAGFRDAFASAGRGFGFTYGQQLAARWSFLRLDHVLVDASIGVADCFVAPAGLSPHRAVIADLVLAPDRK